jgi:hypothetical protein
MRRKDGQVTHACCLPSASRDHETRATA